MRLTERLPYGTEVEFLKRYWDKMEIGEVLEAHFFDLNEQIMIHMKGGDIMPVLNDCELMCCTRIYAKDVFIKAGFMVEQKQEGFGRFVTYATKIDKSNAQLYNESFG